MAKSNTTARAAAPAKDSAPETVTNVTESSDLAKDVADFQATVTGDVAKPEGATGERESVIVDGRRTTPGMTAEQESVAALNLPAPIGHNNPPSGRDIEINGQQVHIPNENYQPTITTYEMLNNDIAEVRKLAESVKKSTVFLRHRLIGLAVDWTILRTSGGGKVRINGTETTEDKLVIVNTAESRDTFRKSLNKFIRSVANYNPQQQFIIAEKMAGGGMESSLTDSVSPKGMTNSSIENLLKEAWMASVLVYFGEYGFTMAYFTPGGYCLRADERKPELSYERKVCFSWNKFASVYKLNGRDVMAPSDLIEASANRVKDAFDVFTSNGEKRLNEYGAVVAKGRAATTADAKPADAEPTDEEKSNLIKAAAAALENAPKDAAGNLIKPAGSEVLPGKPEKDVQTSKDILSKSVVLVETVFSKMNPKTHPLDLATLILRAAKTLMERIDWKSELVQGNDDLLSAEADLNRVCSEIADAMIEQPTRAKA